MTSQVSTQRDVPVQGPSRGSGPFKRSGLLQEVQAPQEVWASSRGLGFLKRSGLPQEVRASSRGPGPLKRSGPPQEVRAPSRGPGPLKRSGPPQEVWAPSRAVLEISSVRRGPARFPPWTIQVRFELSALAYSGDIRRELEKTKKMSLI
jgi:hypothetical protein